MITNLFDLDFSRWDVVLIALVPACINIGIFIYVLFFQPQNETNYVFAIFVFLIGFWQFGDAMGRMSIASDTAMLWYRMSGAFTVFAIPFGLLFIISITKGIGNISNKYLFITLLLPPIFLLLMIIARLDVYNIYPSVKWHWIVNPVPNFFTTIIYLWITLGSLFMLALLWYNYLKTNADKKKKVQILLLAGGFTIPVVGGLIAEVLFPLFLKIDTIPVSTPLLSVFSVASFIAIKKFNLLEYSPKNKWNQILESMNEGILIVDNDERIMYANKIFCEELGYAFEEIHGEIAHEILIDACDLPQMYKIIEDRKNNISSTNEIQLKSKSGVKLWMEIKGSPYTDIAGNIIGSIGILKNIHKEKKIEALYRTLIENVEEIISMVDKEGRFIYVSPAIEKITGYKADELIGTPLTQWVCTEYIKKEKESHLQLIKYPGISSSQTICFIHKNGYKIWLEGTVTNLLEDPNIQAIVSNYHDITERRETEIQLKSANERYDIVAKATSDTIWDLDIVHDRMQYNNGINSMFGYSKLEVDHIGDWWKEKLHPEDLPNVTAALAEMSEKGQTHLHIEYRFRCADGSYKYIYDRGFLINNERGKPIRMIGAMQDINKQKIEENRLKLLESVITNTNDAVIITDIGDENNDVKIIYVNNAYEKMTGYSSEEVLGKNPRILQGPDSDRNVLKQLKNSIGKFEPCEIEIINYKKNGEAFWTDISLAPVSDSKGNYRHWIGIKRDITEKRKQLFEIEEQNRKLKEIAWTQSHLVRAPLARIMGLVNLFNTNAIEEHETKEYLNYILTSANELDVVIKSIVLKTISESNKKIE